MEARLELVRRGSKVGHCMHFEGFRACCENSYLPSRHFTPLLGFHDDLSVI